VFWFLGLVLVWVLLARSGLVTLHRGYADNTPKKYMNRRLSRYVLAEHDNDRKAALVAFDAAYASLVEFFNTTPRAERRSQVPVTAVMAEYMDGSMDAICNLYGVETTTDAYEAVKRDGKS